MLLRLSVTWEHFRFYCKKNFIGFLWPEGIFRPLCKTIVYLRHENNFRWLFSEENTKAFNVLHSAYYINCWVKFSDIKLDSFKDFRHVYEMLTLHWWVTFTRKLSTLLRFPQNSNVVVVIDRFSFIEGESRLKCPSKNFFRSAYEHVSLSSFPTFSFN